MGEICLHHGHIVHEARQHALEGALLPGTQSRPPDVGKDDVKKQLAVVKERRQLREAVSLQQRLAMMPSHKWAQESLDGDGTTLLVSLPPEGQVRVEVGDDTRDEPVASDHVKVDYRESVAVRHTLLGCVS